MINYREFERRWRKQRHFTDTDFVIDVETDFPIKGTGVFEVSVYMEFEVTPGREDTYDEPGYDDQFDIHKTEILKVREYLEDDELSEPMVVSDMLKQDFINYAEKNYKDYVPEFPSVKEVLEGCFDARYDEEKDEDRS